MITDSSGVTGLRLRSFPADGSAEWLAPKDLAVCSSLLATFPAAARSAVEIGVWKGAWSLGILQNVDGSTVVGIDPYPGTAGHEVRALMLQRMASAAVGDRFRLVEDRRAAEPLLGAGRPALIHVDGEHTESATRSDLEWAAQVLAPDGIIVVDDHRHAWFPGIPSAMYGFLREHDFRTFLTTENKAYLCRSGSHADRYERSERLLAGQTDIQWSHHWGEGGEVRYVQVPDVLGCPVLLLIGSADVLPKDAPDSSSGAAGRAMAWPRELARQLLPPVLHRVMGRALRARRPDR